MKLRTITENIEKKDFYDFYALLYAHQNDPNDKEIAQYLQSVTNHIFEDHMNQFANIIINRLCDSEEPKTREMLEKHGIRIDDNDYSYHGYKELPLDQKYAIISYTVALNHKFDYTGETWINLGKTFLKLYNTGPSLKSRILTIDKIYNLLHHGGPITDYMDENWIEDALNTRDNANPAQIFAQASSQVRAIVGRSSYHGQDRRPVSDIDKLYTAFRRKLDTQTEWNHEFDVMSGSMTPSFTSSDVKIQKSGNSLIISSTKYQPINITDAGDYFKISQGKQSHNIYKPIDRPNQFVRDIIGYLSKGLPKPATNIKLPKRRSTT